MLDIRLTVPALGVINTLASSWLIEQGEGDFVAKHAIVLGLSKMFSLDGER